jgi:GT2 family glycosyltransferase
MSANTITGSLVLYHNSREDVKNVIKSFLGYGSTSILIIIDNSLDDSLSELCINDRVKYIFNNSNIGFGAAHNIAFKEAYILKSDYHILLNPDVHFSPTIIADLEVKLESDFLIGAIMPKIIYPSGSTQYLCKLIPTPIDLILRRFLFVKDLKEKLKKRYELRFFSYDEEVEVPIISGCFMFIRSSILEKINGFDERFFMYLEDVDLCRRINKQSKLVYFPKVKVVHNYEKGSYKSMKLLSYHIKSAIKYFNKWGWFFDNERKKTNLLTLKKLNYPEK